MVRSHLNRIPTIWLFFGSLLLLSVAGQAAANLIEDLGQPIWEWENANLENGQTISKAEAADSSSFSDVKPLAISKDNPETFQPLSGAMPLLQPAGQPEPSLAPTTAPLTIIKQGFSQKQDRVVYAFTVNNPNPGVAITNSECRIEFYDRVGKLLSTDSEYIALILPDQTLGIAGTLNLNDEFRVYTIEVNIGEGDAIQGVDFPVFAMGRANFRPGEFFNRTTGLITNRSDSDIQDLKISAIAYDEKGQIIGAGYTFIPFLLASTSTKVDINTLATGTVSSVELHPRASY